MFMYYVLSVRAIPKLIVRYYDDTNRQYHSSRGRVPANLHGFKTKTKTKQNIAKLYSVVHARVAITTVLELLL